MTRQTTSPTKAGVFAFFAIMTLALAGCGNHDQAGGSGTMTSTQVHENTQKQNQPSATSVGQTPAGSTAAPATH